MHEVRTIAEEAMEGKNVMANEKVVAGKMKCGIIMPISGSRYAEQPYTDEYWKDRLQFLKDAISEAGYDPCPVWEDPKEATITSGIAKNIYGMPLAVCVLSSFNSNVLLELGMRLFADKPVLVLFDEFVKKLPFDIGPLGALEVPFHIPYSKIEELKQDIKKKLDGMTKPDYVTYFKGVLPLEAAHDVPDVNKVELSVFMNETRDAIKSTEVKVAKLSAAVEALSSPWMTGYRPTYTMDASPLYRPAVLSGVTGPTGELSRPQPVGDEFGMPFSHVGADPDVK